MEPQNTSRSAKHLTLAADRKGAVAVNEEFTHELDELDLQVQRHRTDLQTIDSQIRKLEETIDLDQIRLLKLKEDLADKVRARTRLTAVRSAMAKFVQGLQARDAR